MTKEDKLEVLELIQDVLSRCEEDIYIPHSSGEGDYRPSINPEKLSIAIRAVRHNLDLMGE